ncbi:hypothetical protein GF340_02480 [Candidatus Peregrinibacteria bacterium]|nr:hypothetical protein [Candidatus Peregrinibacteria bacterium]
MAKKIFYILAGLALLMTLAFVILNKPAISFGQCLTANGFTMYGTDTCSSCKQQKQLLGEDFEQVHYVNCFFSLDSCRKKEIKAYPTWEKNGKLVVGIQTPTELAELSGCKIKNS